MEKKYRLDFYMSHGNTLSLEIKGDLMKVADVIKPANDWISYNMHYINPANIDYIKIVDIAEENSVNQYEQEKFLNDISKLR